VRLEVTDRAKARLKPLELGLLDVFTPGDFVTRIGRSQPA
jgi:hypothetical protein